MPFVGFIGRLRSSRGVRAVSLPTSGFKGATTMKIIASRSNSYAVRDVHIGLTQDAALIAYVK